MTTKVMKAIKLIALPILLSTALISCEGDIEDIGTNIVDNGSFILKSYKSDVLAYNQNDLEVKANRLGQYLLGIYKNDDFGQLKASITGQLIFSTPIDFGIEPSIDSVVLDFPYHATRASENDGNGKPQWELDSIYGDQEVEYNISVYELKTYLNTLDPSNPGQVLDYYSNDTYQINPVALYEGLFKPNKNDTVLNVKRKELEGEVDSFKNPNGSPSIKIPLDTDFFTDNFLTNPDVFVDPGTFVEFFNGLSIQVSEVNDGDEPSIMSLDIANASMTIYYTKVSNDERVKSIANFWFRAVTNNSYERDYIGSNVKPIIDNPNTIDGDARLYLNGAAGSYALIDLFSKEDIDAIRENNWLVNEANLVFHLDDVTDKEILPERLYLYNYDKNSQITDVVIEGEESFGGILERDESGVPLSYTFNITDYMSRVLGESTLELYQLAVKVYNNPSDSPTQVSDLSIPDYSWTPKGVVIHGNQSENIEKRLQLELIYTERE